VQDGTSLVSILFGFPVLFAALWLAVTALIGLMAGWFALARRYPDRGETALAVLKWQSGRMGSIGARLRGVLTLSVCPSGLRVGIFRPFGPFSRDFLVPWSDIEVTRREWLLGRVAELKFGTPPAGVLTIGADVADELARTAQARWPERRRR
jgi:hypothetical protein